MATFLHKVEVNRTITMTIALEAPNKETAQRMADEMAESGDEMLFEEIAESGQGIDGDYSWTMNTVGEVYKASVGCGIDVEPVVASFCADWLVDNVEDD